MRKIYAIALLALWAVSVPARAQENSEKAYSAIRGNNLRGLKALLDHGISPNTPDDRQITPLMYAAGMGSIEAMQMLLDRGADVNAQNAFGQTALMWCATDARKVKLLLDRGADVNKTARSGRTALMLAAFANPSADIVRMLLAKGASANIRDQRGWTPLNAAAFGNDTATIRMLVDAGGDINTPDTFIGWTPLMNAAGNGNLEAVKLLLAKGAQVNAESKRQNLPKIQTGTVQFGGWTALATASAFGPPEVVRTLLDAGAEVNVADVRGLTPLMLAVSTDRAHPEIEKMLLEHRADTKFKSPEGETALDWARKIGVRETIEPLGGSPLPAVHQTRPPETTLDMRTAVERSVNLLEKTNAQFFGKSGCFACHEQPPSESAVFAARAKGIAVDEKAAGERTQQLMSQFNSPAATIEGAAALGGADNNLYVSEALVRGGHAPNRNTDYLAANLAAYQQADGSWHLGGYSRTPLQDSNFSRTAMGIRALKTYGTPGRSAEMKERIERAKQWLLHAAPVILEDYDMRLIGVAAAGASPAELKKLAEPVLSRQRADGGWAQRDNFSSDAYATGMTLYALSEAGVITTASDVYRKGVRYLRNTQAADGSWHVITRATRFQEYFQSGFPYEHDQWISTMGTGWAATALARALDDPRPQLARSTAP